MVIIPHVLAILTFKIEDKKINTKKNHRGKSNNQILKKSLHRPQRLSDLRTTEQIHCNECLLCQGTLFTT